MRLTLRSISRFSRAAYHKITQSLLLPSAELASSRTSVFFEVYIIFSRETMPGSCRAEYLLKCKRQFSSWTLDPIFSHAILTTSQAKAVFFATDTSNTISGFPDCVKRNWRKRKCLMWAHANILTCFVTVLSPNDWFSPQGAILHKERSFIQMNTHIFQGLFI